MKNNIRLLSLFNFFTDFRPWAAIWVLYFQKITGSYTASLSVFSVVFISSAMFEIPTGIFSDRIGRKKTIVLGAFFAVMANVFYAIGISVFILYLGGICEGLSRALYSGNNEALLYGSLQEEDKHDKYHEFLGKTSSMFQLATMTAVIIGGFVAGISYSLVLWISVIPQVICLLLAIFMYEPNVKIEKRGNIYSHLRLAIKNFKQSKKLRLLSLASIIEYGVGNSSFEFQQAFYGIILPVWALGIVRAVSNGAAAVSYFFAGIIIDRFSEIKVLIAESLITPSIKLLTAIFITPLSPFIMAFMSIFYGASSVSANTLQQKEFTNEQRATMGSLISLGGALVTAVASLLLGLSADRFGVILTIIFAQIILLINTTFYYLFKKAAAIS